MIRTRPKSGRKQMAQTSVRVNPTRKKEGRKSEGRIEGSLNAMGDKEVELQWKEREEWKSENVTDVKQ